MTDPELHEPVERRSFELYDLLGLWTLLLAGGLLFLYQLLSALLSFTGRGGTIWGLVVAPVLGILLPLSLLLRRLGLPLAKELWLRRLDGRQLLGVLLLSAGTLPLAYAGSALNLRLVEPDLIYFDFYRGIIPTNTSELVGGVLALVILAPLGEEVVFRVLLLGVLRRHMPPLLAVVLVALLFAAVHFQPWALLPIFILGIVLGLIVLRTGSLLAAWIAHALFNLVAYVELLQTGDVATGEIEAFVTRPAILGLGAVGLLLGFRLLQPGPTPQRLPANAEEPRPEDPAR
ncbi:MAG: CPBP family intramembrane metalloprotease [Candidatus Latescibacterota bacterium]|nr:MAG: CPBP family intramembrane metalloprotease [Candidatus Latescibacterota bacterium]